MTVMMDLYNGAGQLALMKTLGTVNKNNLRRTQQ